MSKLVEEQCMKGHKGRVWGIAWHPKGNAFASCGQDKTIRIWAANNNNWTTKTTLLDGHTRTIREVNWSPCGQYIASASFDGSTALWSKTSGEFECNATLEGHENEVKSVSWSHNGMYLATCSRDKSVWIWEVVGEDEYDCAAVMNVHSQDVKRVTWHPTKNILASASYDNSIKIFSESAIDNDWDCTATLLSHESTVWGISFDATGERLASCSDDKTVKIWQAYHPGNEEGIHTPDNETVWKCICTISGMHNRVIYDIDWCKKTGLIATSCGDDAIRIFKEDEGCPKNEPTFSLIASCDKAHTEDVNAVRWNPVQIGKLLSCSDDGTIKVWKFIDELK